MIEAQLLDDCHKLALEIAPELAERPLYIVDANDLDGLPRRNDCLGWALSEYFFDRNLGDRLGPKYVGVGPVIVLDGDKIRDEAHPGQFERYAMTIAIHEVAHVLPPRTIREPADTDEVRETQLGMSKRDWKLPDATPDSPDDCHGPKFIRTAIHLWVRACEAGRDIPIHGLLSGWHVSQPAHYLATLLREAMAMRDRTFREIEATPPPVAFTDLWKSDLEFYLRLQKGKA